VTLAEACDGRFGIQPGFVSSRTGDPIDCGPAPAPAVVAAPAPVPAPVVAEPEPLRMTLAEVCAAVASTGKRFVDAATGQPIVCEAPRVVVASVAPAAPAGPAAPAAPTLQAPVTTVATAQTGCPNVSSIGQAYLMRGTGLPIRCYPQELLPYTLATPAPEQVTRRAAAPLFGQPAVPASNPRVVAAETIRPPAGYVPVWDDGRLNPQRGLPRTVAAPVVQQPAARISSRSVAPAAVAAPAALTHRYVQIGSFGDPANAQRTTRLFQGMGLPVATQASGGLQVIAIGPFGSAEDLQRGLQAARNAGFADAFLRN
jgi:hypothetical protein